MKTTFIYNEEDIRQLVIGALKRRRKTIVFGIAKRLEEAGLANGPVQQMANTIEVVENEWKGVESLSQLRSLVGGRFKNLKEKWTSAGLPLRQHRGDRSGEAVVNQQGWLALSLWVNKQGYEIRLSNLDTPSILEVRRLES